MGSQENNSGAANTRKKPFRKFIKKSNNKGNNNNSNKSKSSSKSQTTVREYKFHLHDSAGQKTSESFKKLRRVLS